MSAGIRWDLLATMGDNLAAGLKRAREAELFSRVGQSVTGPNPDYNAAAQTLFAGGRGDMALQLMTLGEQYRQRQLGEKASADFSAGLGNLFGGSDPAVPSPSNPAAGAPPPAFDPRSLPAFVGAAGERYGISPDFMNRTAWIESKGNPRAVSPTGAKGLMQFTGGTARQYGLSDPFDPQASADAGARLAADNKRVLASALGRDPSDAELYLAHQQGAGGAAALLSNPNAPAVDALAQAYGGDRAKAARAITVNGGNPNMTAGQFAGLWTGKFNALGPAGGAPPPAAPEAPTPGMMRLPAQVAGTGNWFDDRMGPQPFPDRAQMLASVGQPEPAFGTAGRVTVPQSGAGRARMASAAPADAPAPGAAEAQFFVPPGGGAPVLAGSAQPQSAPTPQLPAPTSGAPAGSEVIAGRPVASIAQSPLGQRIPFLIKAASHAHLPANQREVAKSLLLHALNEAKIPDGAKEFMWARANGMTQASTMAEYAREKSGGDVKITNEVDQRRQAASGVGLRPDSPGYQTYLLTGKMPREDQQPLSASDRKAIMEADEGVMAAENVINALREAKRLSTNSLEGPFASERGYLGSLFGTERGVNTANLDNLVKTNALGQLKSIFGAAPTEGERKILLEIQGSASQPDVVRQAIFDRAIALAERRLAMNRERATDLRGGTYYRPDGGRPSSGSEGVVIPPGAADHLRRNPQLRDAFEEKYGRGSAAQVLGR